MRLILLLAGLWACTEPVPTPEPEPPITPVPSPEPEPDLFEQIQAAPTALPQFRIELPHASMDLLREWPREWQPGTVQLGDEIVEAEVRLKGNGSFQPLDDRPSFKLKLDRPLAGFDRLVLNNGTTDPTRLHEVLASHALRELGIPTARAENAWVELNGTTLSVYTVLEDVDEPMLSRWFDDPEGSLYELFDGDFAPGSLGGFEHESGPDDRGPLLAAAADLALGDVVGFEFGIEHFDRDAFFRFWAASVALAQTDAYPYSAPGDDVYVYVDPADDRMHFIPHGLDEAFSPRGRTIGDTNGVLARRCLVLNGCRAEFEQALHGVFDDLRLIGFEDEVAIRIQRARDWAEDPNYLDPEVPIDPDHVAELRDWVDLRQATVFSELDP